jgi:hypothetical protein
MKCDTIDCPNEATARVFWPGDARSFCDSCKTRAETIAQAMGFTLESTPARTVVLVTNAATAVYREPYEPPAITRSESLDRTCCERFAWSGTTHSTYCDASGLIAKWERHSLLDFNTAKAVALVVRAARAEISIRYTYSSDGDGWIGAYDKNGAPLTGGQCHRGHLIFECLEMALAEISK